jgi:hypothetical protein
VRHSWAALDFIPASPSPQVFRFETCAGLW